jgi:hypothetical protein
MNDPTSPLPSIFLSVVLLGYVYGQPYRKISLGSGLHRSPAVCYSNGNK